MFSQKIADSTLRAVTIQAWGYKKRSLPIVAACSSTAGMRFSSSSSSNHEYQYGRRHNSTHNSHSGSGNSGQIATYLVSAVGASCVIGAALYWKLQNQKLYAAEHEIEPGAIRGDLPTYTLAQVATHKNKQKRIWVTYKNGVYDITDYVSSHPGGSKILLAAGGSMEPFWNMYAVHKHPEILSIAETLRIGNITEVSVDETTNTDDPYANEPKRSPLLIPSSKKPFNAEPSPELLVDNFVTPNDIFFVRNHLPVPNIDESDWYLEVVGPNNKQTCYLACRLQMCFKKKTTMAALQCAGDRRNEMIEIKEVKGLTWAQAAIGNAEWSGALLNDVLKDAGIDIESTQKKHLVFEGMDQGPDGGVYGASIPIELARALKNEIIIAYEMNGEPLSRDHGFPARVIIPGVVGARQVKWLKKIYLSDEESDSHWQRRDYKGFNPSVDWDTVDFDKSVAIQQLPVISAICEPLDMTELDRDVEELTLRGYAWSGGGRAIIRVDVSIDGGKTWQEAELTPNRQTQYRAWAWTLWEATVEIPKDSYNEVELISKAVDISYNVQPDTVEGIWNLRGVLNNAWHRIVVFIPGRPTKKKEEEVAEEHDAHKHKP